MRKYSRDEWEQMGRSRPALVEWLAEIDAVELWKLTDQPTTMEAHRAGQDSPFFWAKASNGKTYFVRYMKKCGKLPGRVVTWIGCDLPKEEKQRDYILIEKAKVGRPKREWTDADRAKIDKMKAAGVGINKIAAALHCSNRRIIDYLRGNNSF